MATKRLVTILGATGHMGEDIIDELAQNPTYRLRGTTRDPDSDAAAKLRSRGIEVVQADTADLDSLVSAFAGSNVIFAATDFWGLFAQHGPAKACEMEIKQGRDVVEAALATMDTLEHFIWVSLPKPTTAYPEPHFEAKHAVEMAIRTEHPQLAAKTTFLVVCVLGRNLALPFLRPRLLDDGKYVQLVTWDPQTSIPFIVDAGANIRPFIREVIRQSSRTRGGAIVLACSQYATATEWVQAWATAKGLGKVHVVRVGRDVYDELWPFPQWADMFSNMFAYFENVPVPEWGVPGQLVLTKEDLGIGEDELLSLQAWAEDFDLPPL
jgi:hypothetical protein